MRRNDAVRVVMLLMLLLQFLVSVSGVQGATIYVNSTGWWLEGNSFNSTNTPIQEAVDNSSVLGANVIKIDVGLYNETVNVTQIPQWLLITNNGTGMPHINGMFSDYVFNVSASNVTIQGLELINATYGVYTPIPVVNLTVRDCSFTINLDYGIYLDGCVNCTLDNNTISNFQQYGIYLNNSTNCQISTNTISSQTGWGIYLNASSNNQIYTNGLLCSGGLYLNSSYNNWIFDNYFANSQCNAYDNCQNHWNLTLPRQGPNILGGSLVGGNFWSDYAGDDFDGDGIADHPIPYNCSGNITYGGDYMPLLALYFVEPTPQSWNATNANVTINVTYVISNPRDIWLNFNNTLINITSTLNQTIDTSQYPEGVYWYYANMTDRRGMMYWTATRYLIVDRTPPVFDFFVTPDPDSSVYGYVKIKVAFHEEEGSGIANVTFYYSNTSSSNVLIGTSTSPETGKLQEGRWYSGIWSITWDTTSLADGPYTLIARAYDNAGNWVQSQINVTLDNDRLVLSASSDTTPTYANQRVYFYANYTHAGNAITPANGGMCTIQINYRSWNGSITVSTSGQMTYNSSSGLYEFNVPGYSDWGVIKYTIQANNTAGFENITKTSKTWIIFYRSRSGYVYDFNNPGVGLANVTIRVVEDVPGGTGNPWTYTTTTNESGYYEIVFNDTTDPLGSCYLITAYNEYGNLSTPAIPSLPGPMPNEPNETVNMYLVPAANLTLHAYNSAGATTFDAMIFDRITKAPIRILNKIGPANYSIYLPLNRTYDIIIWKEPTPGVFPPDGCPPISYNWTPTTAGELRYIDANLTVSKVTVEGYMSGLTGGVYTNVTAYMTIGSFTPLDFDAGFSSYVDSSTGYYNITLPGTQDGIKYIIMGYGRNASGYYMGIKEVTVQTTNLQNQNITLLPLAGEFRQGSIPTNKTRFYFYDDSGNNVSGAFAILNVAFGDNNWVYVISSRVNNTIDVPLLKGSSVVAQFMTPQSAPRQYKYNASYINSNANINVILPKFELKDPDTGNILQNARLKFLRSSSECNGPYPPDSCVIAEVTDITTFNPIKILMGGKLNIRIEQPNGLVVEFINVDLIASGPPDAQFSPNAIEQETTNVLAQIWKIGSFAPEIYDYVLIGVPYNDSEVNESQPAKVHFRYLYDDNFNVIWDSQVNSYADAVNLGYGDYNPAYLNGTGLTCSDTMPSSFSPNGTGYRDKVNNTIWFTIPHFSGGAPMIEQAKAEAGGTTGTSPTGGTSGGTTGGTGGGGGGGAIVVSPPLEATAEMMTSESKVFEAGKEVKLSISGELAESTHILEVSAVVDETMTLTFTLSKAKLPRDVSPPKGKVYSTFEIVFTKYGTTQKVEPRGSIKFRVSKAWAEQEGVSPSQIVLAKYANGWVEVETKFEGEDSEYYYFRANLDSFSLFAIVAKTEAVKTPTKETPTAITPTPTVVKTVETTTPQEIETTKGIPGFEAVIALAVVAMAALVARKL